MVMKSFSSDQMMERVVHECFIGIFSQSMHFSQEACICPVLQRDERERGREEEDRRGERASPEIIIKSLPT